MQRIPLTQVQMLKSLNSLLIKFNVSTQETSCKNLFSSRLYVREFFLDNSLVQEIFSYAYALAGFFFFRFTQPPPPQKLNGWPLMIDYLTCEVPISMRDKKAALFLRNIRL